MCYEVLFWSSERSGSRERLMPSQSPSRNRRREMTPREKLPNGRLQEMEPLTEQPTEHTEEQEDEQADDLTASNNSGVESWLENSSKYHSCEIVDE